MAIKETEEAIGALVALVQEYRVLKADGKLDLSDLLAFIDKINTDAVFAKKLMDGWQGLDLIAGELSHVSFMEALQLLKDLSALKKA